LDIRLGDTVIIKRSGDVIPYVIGPVKGKRTGDEQTITPPEHCPFCDTAIVQPEGMVDHFCPNPVCPERVFRSVEFFVSRGAMDIDGMGPQTVRTLIDEGIIEDEADIFTLPRTRLLELEGFGEKKVDHLLASIDTARQRPLARLIAALGIDGVGGVVAQSLSDRFGTMDALMQASIDEIDTIDGIGPILAQNIADWFSDAHHRKLIDKMRAAGVSMQAAAREQSSDRLAELTFVLTGELPTLTRDAAIDLIKAHGGSVKSGVSKKTSFVLAGESPGSKLDKARSLNVPVIDEAELRRMIES
ncbi:MAG: helix-hairpin-helix domain-containing protein, partial [Chloroflexota bacterium]